MTARFLLAPALVALSAGAFGGARSAPTVATKTGPPADGAAQTTTLDDQTELYVTVYNSNIALVRDIRNLTLTRGESDLHFMDIAATVNPATVHFRSLTEPTRVSVLEQNYEYDLLEPEKLLRKYVGRDVTLVRRLQTPAGTREESVTAHLLSYNNGPVWRINGEIVTGMQADHIRFPELPGNLYSRPTLIWTLDNSGGTRHRVEASYLASNLAWNADYVLTVSRDDKAADLDGWVTLKNGSGTSFPKVALQFVAGDLNRIKDVISKSLGEMRRAESVAAAPMQQESFSEYHLYSLGRKTTINNNETKQLEMLGATSLPVLKRYVVDGQEFYYRNALHPGSPQKDDVAVYYQFKNDEKSGLGVPMPAGAVRVYQSDSKGGIQFVGEDRIDHTAKDETLNLKIGNAFDVVAERKQTDFQKISSSVYEMEFQITLRNHKTTPITVEVNEPIGGTWRMLRSTYQYTKTDAWASQFMVPVAADGTSVLTFRVRVTY